MSADPHRFDHLDGPGLLAGAIRAESLLGATGHGTCRFCGGRIHFAPYFLDGKLPNPPVWIHTDGAGTTCSTLPKGWGNKRWPHAEPAEDAGGAS